MSSNKQNEVCKNRLKRFIFKLEVNHKIIASFLFKGAKILDFGCGDCKFFDSLGGMGRLTGCEINKERLNKAKEKGYEVYQSLDEIKGKFDFVILCEVIEHLNPEEAKDFFKKIQPLLNKGGKLIMSTPNPNELYTKLEDHKEHKKLYTIDELKNFGRENNFKTIKVIKHHIRVNPLKIIHNLIKGKDIYTGYTIIMESQHI